MKATIFRPATKEEWLELRTHDLTSTESAALFGLSPYLTAYELWHRKAGHVSVEIEENERMRWGTRLQDSIAAGIAEDRGWTIRRMSEYVRLDAERLGASFDFAVEAPERGILEVKNVDGLAFKEGWAVDGESVEAPPHIEIQLQHQLLVSGHERAWIGALVGGNRAMLIERQRVDSIADAIKSKAAEFWKSIDANQPPKPDFEKDAEFISKMMQAVKPGTVIESVKGDALDFIANEYIIASAAAVKADKYKAAVKAQILIAIGDAEKVKGQGWTLSAGLTKETVIPATTKSAYRNFRIYPKKEEAK